MNRLSIAIWLAHTGVASSEPQAAEAATSRSSGDYDYEANWIDVHLNFWLLEDKTIIDIGIMFPCVATEQTVNIYINNPNIDSTNVQEITKLLADPANRNMVFNEKLKSDESCFQPHIRTCCMLESEECVDDHKKFCLDFNENKHNAARDEHSDGVIVTINVRERQCEKGVTTVYSRIRITGDAIKNIFPFIEDPSCKWQYHNIEYRFIDLRVNDIRTLPNQLCDYKRLPEIRHLRCLFMVDATLQMVCRSLKYEKVRCLEKKLWKNYLGDIEEDSNIPVLAYQWNADSDVDASKIIKDFQLFLKIRKSYVDRRKMRAAVLIVLGLGAVGSLIATLITKIPDVLGWISNIIAYCAQNGVPS